MKLLTFHRNNILQLGIRTEAGLIDVAQASDEHARIPVTMVAAIRGGAEAMKSLWGLVKQPAANWLLNEQDYSPGTARGLRKSLFASG